MTISNFSKTFGSMEEIVKAIEGFEYGDDVISQFLDQYDELVSNNEADDNSIYEAFVKCVTKTAYNEVPSFSSVSNTIRITVSNRRCYYSKDGYGISVSSLLKDGKLSFILGIEINKDPDILKATRNTHYSNLIKMGFEVKAIEVGKRK